MTPKQKVLKVYPNAYAADWYSEWVITALFVKKAERLGTGNTQDEAWASAAANLPKKGRK